jgi:hypothetical protein
MHGLDPAFAQPALQPQIEIGPIDTDEDRGRMGDEMLPKLAAQTQQFGQMGQDLGQAHDRQPLHVEQGLTADLTHPWTGHANEAHLWILGADRLRQGRPEQVARGFIGHQSNADRATGDGWIEWVHRRQRTNPRPVVPMNSTKGWSSGTEAARAAIRARASSSLRSAR